MERIKLTSEEKEQIYKLLAEYYLSYWSEEIKYADKISKPNEIIILEFGDAHKYDSWEDFCECEEIILCNKYEDLSIKEEDWPIINKLLAQFGKSL